MFAPVSRAHPCASASQSAPLLPLSAPLACFAHCLPYLVLSAPCPPFSCHVSPALSHDDLHSPERLCSSSLGPAKARLLTCALQPALQPATDLIPAAPFCGTFSSAPTVVVLACLQAFCQASPCSPPCLPNGCDTWPDNGRSERGSCTHNHPQCCNRRVSWSCDEGRFHSRLLRQARRASWRGEGGVAGGGTTRPLRRWR